jgi:bifunctional DNA-binding transcriptional regulator/antitoxin component of YhaV-PrlF toxin-antitoxin module
MKTVTSSKGQLVLPAPLRERDRMKSNIAPQLHAPPFSLR